MFILLAVAMNLQSPLQLWSAGALMQARGTLYLHSPVQDIRAPLQLFKDVSSFLVVVMVNGMLALWKSLILQRTVGPLGLQCQQLDPIARLLYLVVACMSSGALHVTSQSSMLWRSLIQRPIIGQWSNHYWAPGVILQQRLCGADIAVGVVVLTFQIF
jgi:hypothetical protein